LKREDAIVILTELLDGCGGLDGHNLELAPPTSAKGGYQIVIRGILDEKTRSCIQAVIAKHELASQTGSIWKTSHTVNKEPDTLVIYKPKKSPL
jgi:hypothetical protein